jgi:3-oxoacyl-[acyl-carrier-protein] synthase-3
MKMEQLWLSNEVVIKKLKNITGIEHRRYEDHLTSSDLAFFAAEKAMKMQQSIQRLIDYIILPIILAM